MLSSFVGSNPIEKDLSIRTISISGILQEKSPKIFESTTLQMLVFVVHRTVEGYPVTMGHRCSCFRIMRVCFLTSHLHEPPQQSWQVLYNHPKMWNHLTAARKTTNLEKKVSPIGKTTPFYDSKNDATVSPTFLQFSNPHCEVRSLWDVQVAIVIEPNGVEHLPTRWSDDQLNHTNQAPNP